MEGIYDNIGECSPNKKQKILIIFDMVADLNLIVTELLIRERKLNVSFVFVTQCYFAVPRNRLNSTHYFIKKNPNKQELQQIVFNHLSNIGFKGFTNLYKKCTAKPYSLFILFLYQRSLYILERIF